MPDACENEPERTAPCRTRRWGAPSESGGSSIPAAALSIPYQPLCLVVFCRAAGCTLAPVKACRGTLQHGCKGETRLAASNNCLTFDYLFLCGFPFVVSTPF